MIGHASPIDLGMINPAWSGARVASLTVFVKCSCQFLWVIQFMKLYSSTSANNSMLAGVQYSFIEKKIASTSAIK